MSKRLLQHYLDTNTLLQYQLFDSIDWPKITEANSVCLVLAPVVLGEIDLHKNSSTNARLHSRSRAVLPVLRKYLDNSEAFDQPTAMRDNVTILAIAEEPQVAWQTLGLDPTISDDRLIASLIQFKEDNPLTNVMLITNDFTPRQKARRHGFTAIDPDDYPQVIAPLPQRSEQDEELEKLRRENTLLKTQLPKVQFGLWDASAITNHVSSKGIRQKLDLTWKYINTADELGAFIQSEIDQGKLIIEGARQSNADRSDIDEFTTLYGEYVKRLPDQLLYAQSRHMGIAFELRFGIKNIGNVLITDIQTKVEFPQWSVVLEKSHVGDTYSDELSFPERPKPKWLERRLSILEPFAGMSGSNTLRSNMMASFPIIAPKRTEGWFYYRDTRSAIALDVGKLQPGSRYISEPVVAYLPPNIGQGFTIQYTIHADNLRKPIIESLNIVLGSEHVS